MRLICVMKRASVRKNFAPAPWLTLWVPVMVAGALSLFWLGLLVLV